MSNMALNYSSIPNPFAPEAWIFADAVTLKLYAAIAMGLLSVLVWDILSCLPDEVTLIFKHNLTFPTFFYCLARFSPLCFMSLHQRILTHDLDHCVAWVVFLNVFYTCTHTSSGMLFLLRLRAVYAELPTFKWVFSGLWVIHAASCTLSFLAVRGILIVPVHRCIPGIQKQYWIIMFSLQAGYELLVCVAITFKLCYDTSRDPEPLRFWWMIRRHKNPMLKLRVRFLADSQAYFVCVFLIKIVIIISCFVGSDAVQLVCGLLDNVIISLIATKVHRQFKLGKHGLLTGQTSFTVNGGGPSISQWRVAKGEGPTSSIELSNVTGRDSVRTQRSNANPEGR
ncbi:hypothetical protein CPB83DRAFT_860466 [Crepidotus variabilis]|uniref:DUF6533 domain-containing protein n=1 Tax=Crepidotus variabilis TaxID=179855 RepID=A0A9P6E9N2_9AGAR|nr:hypothetical protein CPB83DRAFT_860466 [Crepidotus variabilis]